MTTAHKPGTYEEYLNDPTKADRNTSHIIETRIAALEHKMNQLDEVISVLGKICYTLEIISKTVTKHEPPEVILPRDQYPTKSSR